MRIVIAIAVLAAFAINACQSSESVPEPPPKPSSRDRASGESGTPQVRPATPLEGQVEKVNEALRASGLVATPSSVTGEDAWWIPADTACPEGATLQGAPPPGGTEIWCALPDGRRHGRATKWGKIGNKLADGEHRKGVKHGRFTAYHKHGGKSMAVSFVDGKEHGKVTTWHPNGQKSLEGEYRNGKGHGAWTKWDASGKKIAEGSY